MYCQLDIYIYILNKINSILMKILMLTNNNDQINHHCSVLYNLLTVRVYYGWIIIVASDNEMVIIDIYRHDKWKVIVKNGKW